MNKFSNCYQKLYCSAFMVLIIFLFSNTAMAQCPNGSIQFYSQADVNDFPVNYPSCTQIVDYQVFISGSDITDLSPLSQLTYIHNLNISDCSSLTSLNGLQNLTTIKETLQITDTPIQNLNELSGVTLMDGDLNEPTIYFQNCDVLTDVSGLSNISGFDGYLSFSSNDLLSDLTGVGHFTNLAGLQINVNLVSDLSIFSNLLTVGYLHVSNNTHITSLAGLENVTTIDELRLFQVYNLTDMSAIENITSYSQDVWIQKTGIDNVDYLQNCTSIGGELRISADQNITDLSGLSSLTSVGGDLKIWFLSNITSLNGLQNLNTVSGELKIANNNNLNDISDLSALDYTTLSSLEIINNPLLSSCSFDPICLFLNQYGANYNIANNATGCDTDTEILSSCDIDPCTHPDYYALEVFYVSTNGNNWDNNTGWLTDCEPCNWYGITCDGNDRVTSIDLDGTVDNVVTVNGSGNNLTGFIPNEIEEITYLEKLNLSFNAFYSPIPNTIGNLSNLDYLGLSHSELTGSIPSEIGDCLLLTHIYLSSNNLSGSIPTEIGQLQNLEYLWVFINNLNGGVPSEIGDCSSLTHFAARNNNFGGTVPPELGNLGNLEYLGLSGNEMVGEIPMEIFDLSQLKSLDLGFNSFTGTVPDNFANLPELTGLVLQYNNFDGDLPESIGDLSNLNYLYMRNNNFSGCFPDNYSNLCGISAHQFQNNPLLPGGGNFDSFCSSGNGSCSSLAECDNGVQDIHETNLDCGGPVCDPCNSGYCDSYSNNSSYEWIEQVEIGTLNNTSGDNGAYANYTDQSVDLASEELVDVILTPGFNGGPWVEYWSIWIDLNGDEDFDDADELVFTDNSNGVITGSFTMPELSADLTTRMRVAMKYNSYSDPCDVSSADGFGYGEVEDYTVNLIGASAGPDIFITNHSISTDQLSEGDLMTVYLTQNISDPATPAATPDIHYYISTDNVYDGADDLVGTDWSSIGGGDASDNENMTYALGAYAPATYYLIAVCDASDEVAESDENNNESYLEFEIIEAAPPGDDFYISHEAVSSTSIGEGGSTTASCKQNYNGTSTTTLSVKMGYYLSVDNVFDGADILLEDDNSTLSVSDTNDPESATITIPTGTAVGNYYILFVADHIDAYAETDESNNTEAVAIEVTAPEPAEDDFFITDESMSNTNPDFGESVTLSCKQAYDGNSGSSLPVYMGYYLSEDAVFDGGDTYIDDDYSSLSATDLDDPESDVYSIPTDLTAGVTYYILFVADHEDEYAETDEDNNVSYVAFTVGVSSAQMDDTSEEALTAIEDMQIEEPFIEFSKSYWNLDCKIYPNPAKEHITIELDKPGIYRYQIVDAMGKKWKDGIINAQIQLINIDQLPSSILHLRIMNAAGQIVTKQFVKI